MYEDLMGLRRAGKEAMPMPKRLTLGSLFDGIG